MAVFEVFFGYEPTEGVALKQPDHSWQAYALFHLPAHTLEQLDVFPSFVRAYQFEREFYHEQWEDMREYKISIDFPADMDIDGEFREEWEGFDATGSVCDPEEVKTWAARWRHLIERARAAQDLNRLWPLPEWNWNTPLWDWNERLPGLLDDLTLVEAHAACASAHGVRMVFESGFYDPSSVIS